MVATGSQLGPYRLVRRIGAGGMAEVFLAQRIGAEGFSRTVAIKTILAVGAEEEGIGLFLDEARVAGYLDHPAIVQTVDLGFENDTLFIVMEYIAGPALSRVIRDLKKLGRFLPAELVAYVGARVASALDYAHRRATTPDGKPLELVHRDISPQNIMLTRNGMVKLTDFGVARASVQTHKTRTGQVRGKAAYMAPEQVRAGKLDGRTDIFALALVLYEALTGVRAYQRKTDIMSMRAILTDEVQPIRELNPAAPEDLIAVLSKALSKKPNDRYAHASELAEALAATYRSTSEAVIEAEITRTINELFGPEQFSTNAEGPVEAWQPTISAKAEGEGSNPTPHRISGARLSPKIAAMLQGTPPSSTPVTPVVFDPGSGAELGAGDPAEAFSPVAYASVAQAQGYYPGTGGPQDSANLQSASGRGLAAEPVAFGEVIDPHREPGLGAPLSGPAGYAAGHAPGHAGAPGPGTPTSLAPGALTDPGARPKGRGMIWAAVFIGSGIVVASAVLALNRSSTAKNNPAARASQEPAVRAESKPEVRGREPSAAPSPGTIERIDPDELARGTPPGAPEEKARPRDPATQKRAEGRTKVSPPEVGPAAGRDPPSPTATDPAAFLVRAIAAKKRSDADPELRRELTKLINDLQIAPRAITRADLDLVQRAESTPR